MHLTTLPDSRDSSELSFGGLELRGKITKEYRFENCSFTKCSFVEATFRDCSFLNCTFQDCDFSNSHWTGSRLRDLRFVDSKLVGINWTHAAALADLKFERSILSYGLFGALDLRRFAFSDCTLREVDFAEANLSGSDFRGADLAGTTFFKSDLREADFRKALNYSIRPLDNRIKKAKFSLPEASLLLYGLDIVVED